MDKMFSRSADTADRYLSVASIVGVYSPLIVILATALVLF